MEESLVVGVDDDDVVVDDDDMMADGPVREVAGIRFCRRSPGEISLAGLAGRDDFGGGAGIPVRGNFDARGRGRPVGLLLESIPEVLGGEGMSSCSLVLVGYAGVTEPCIILMSCCS